MKRFGDWPITGQKYTRRPGVYAILPIGDGILATFQGGQNSEYQLPGGGIDSGEQPIAALHREVMEETGWTIASPKVFFRFKRAVFMPDYDMWAEKICTIYVATPVRRISAPLEDNHTATFMPYETAINFLGVFGDRFAVSLLGSTGKKSSITALRSSSKTGAP